VLITLLLPVAVAAVDDMLEAAVEPVGSVLELH
jgi:hypothetical protein